MRERLLSDLRFMFRQHRLSLVAVGCAAFQLIFLVATAQGTRAEVRKQLDQPISGSTYRVLATIALGGRDPVEETDTILTAMFGTLVLLNLVSAATVVSNTMLLVVEQRRPLIGRSRALGASRGEVASQTRLAGALSCALTALPAAGLAWLIAAAFNATNVLHIWLDIGLPVIGLATGLLGTAGLIGSWLPARLAAKVDPWDALVEPPPTWRALAPRVFVIAVSFWLALLLVGLGGGAREATLEKYRAMPIIDPAAFDTLYGKVNQSMSSFRLILLLLPIVSCLSVVGSTVQLAAHRERRRLALDRAFGAPRQRLGGRIVAQSVGLCLLAWLLAVPLAEAAAVWLNSGPLPFAATVPPGGLLFTLGASGLIGLGGAVGPALRVLRTDPAEMLKGTT